LNKKKPTICVMLVALLLSAFLLVRPVVAEETGYQNISVQQAKHIIKHNPNVVILDVRNQSEYDLGHLYDAQLIPLGSLENRTMPLNLPLPPANDSVMLDVYQRVTSGFNLSAYANNPIIVYCQAGSRSAIACQVLAEHGFTEVYNMLGGITAWMQADYQIYTSNHYVTVDFNNDEALIDIQPLLLYQANCPCNNFTNQSMPDIITPQNMTDYEVLENSTEKTVYRFTFDNNGDTSTVTINRTQLWRYNETEVGYNRFAALESIDTTLFTEGYSEVVLRTLDFIYDVRSADYKLALRTEIREPSNESYGIAYTTLGYAPTNDTGALSTEKVDFVSSIKLSDHYLALSKVSKKLATLYATSGNDLSQFSIGYSIMQHEAENFHRMVVQNLTAFDKLILNCSATLIDSPCTDLCSIYCGYAAGILNTGICMWLAGFCGAGYFPCLIGCLAGFGALTNLACSWMCTRLCDEEFNPNSIGCVLACGAVCGPCEEAGFGPFCWTCTLACERSCYDLFPSQPDPDPGELPDYWGTSVYDTETWENAYIDSAGNILGDFPDQNYAELAAWDYGSMARIIVTLNAQATGGVLINGYSNYGYNSRVIVYVSGNAQNWNLIYDDYVADTSPVWIYCGYASNINYVMINVYSEYYYDCDLFVDNVCVVEEDQPPENEYFWAQSVSWTDAYGAGSAVNNPWNMLGSSPNGNYGQLYAPNYGCTARVSLTLNQPSVGQIDVYGYSVSGYYSLFYVYVSNDDYNWNFVKSQVVSSSSPGWISFGPYTSPFRYVLLLGYDSGNSVNLQIDAVRVTP
jgi:rhodanese-related sulfurtransferase